jgi:acyl carrier protein
MSDPALFEQVRRIFADVLNVPAGILTMRSSPEEISAWDSVHHLSLMLALEQHFQLQFNPDEMDQLTSLGHIAASVDQKLNG